MSMILTPKVCSRCKSEPAYCLNANEQALANAGLAHWEDMWHTHHLGSELNIFGTYIPQSFKDDHGPLLFRENRVGLNSYWIDGRETTEEHYDAFLAQR